jgi:hypothetical protein
MALSSLTTKEATIRRLRIDSVRMNLRQRRVFEVYLGMGPERSLERLYGYCLDEGIAISLTGLKNWSKSFAWQPLIDAIEADIAVELGKILLPDHVERVRGDLQRIQRMKMKFYEKVDADEIDLTVDDFIKLLKVEDMLLSKPLERPGSDEITGKYKVEVILSEDEIALAMRISAAKRHGLPMPQIIGDAMKNVTPRDADETETAPTIDQ